MKYDLKTCPFCGGTPYIESDSRGFYKGESAKVAFVRCMTCNMRFSGISMCTVGDHT